MPSLSAATAVMVMLVPAVNAAPLIGPVRLTVGGALAAATTVMVTGAEVAFAPQVVGGFGGQRVSSCLTLLQIRL